MNAGNALTPDVATDHRKGLKIIHEIIYIKLMFTNLQTKI